MPLLIPACEGGACHCSVRVCVCGGACLCLSLHVASRVWKATADATASAPATCATASTHPCRPPPDLVGAPPAYMRALPVQVAYTKRRAFRGEPEHTALLFPHSAGFRWVGIQG